MKYRGHHIILLLVSIMALPVAAAAGERVGPEVYQRTVFLGDSITDGNTYPQLVRDALAGASCRR